MSNCQVLHVVAAVLEDDQGRILVTQRPAGKRQAGRWEFPGGKVEAGESVHDALARELREELGVEPLNAEPVIKLQHDYPDFSVFLDVHRVNHWRGDIRALESQAMQWRLPHDLHEVDILEADLPIIHALCLPPAIVITPAFDGSDQWWSVLRATLASHGKDALLQFRQPQLSESEYVALAGEVIELAAVHGAGVMLNGSPALLERVPAAAGVHLPGRVLDALCNASEEVVAKPIGKEHWLSASVHDQVQLEKALKLKADFVTISPVNVTSSHPDAIPLGWRGFEKLAALAGIPCYALGGMQAADVAAARQHGGQGVAGISSFWVSGS